jgi:hypothetical protein
MPYKLIRRLLLTLRILIRYFPLTLLILILYLLPKGPTQRARCTACGLELLLVCPGIYIHIYIHIHICIYMYIYIYVYIYICMYI